MNELFSEAADILEQIADDVLFVGWLQGEFGEHGKAQCASGHINWKCFAPLNMENHIASDEFRDELWYERYERRRALQQITSHAFGKHVMPYHEAAGLSSPASAIAVWNDVPGRTVEEVRDAFLHTAKELRNSA